ncbi:MAG: DNA photolyase family protein [Actinomycetota bacterium]|nr:DNA photolyase family protein [Actinomycetota bacterium]
MASVMWFRRDLRLHDQPALNAAAHEGPVVALYVLDPALLKPAGPARIAFLYRSLRSLDDDLRGLGGRLVLRRGRPATVVPALVREVAATAVHVTADYGPYGRRRDEAVARALGDVALISTGSPYAVAPGRVLKADGTPYKVFTPFYRAWCAHGWRAPARRTQVDWQEGAEGLEIPSDPTLAGELVLPGAGEAAAREAWQAYRSADLGDYPAVRDRPDLDRTSHLSVWLKWGAIHPRTLLAQLTEADEVFRRELAWREFYASVLHHWPPSAREYFQPQLASIRYDEPGTRFDAWREGRTGYPIVDAGMRQLLALGWMHNRVRMIVASFLVKDLHIEWTHGARHFMRHLVDADLASNQHGWQWTAGSGTDASPFFRIFNPTTQGRKFDPDGDYVRRWIPELRSIPGPAVHEPWRLDPPPAEYPPPIIDHSVEREQALERFQQAR